MKPARAKTKKAKAAPGEPRAQPSAHLLALARAYHYAALHLPADQLTEAGRAYRAQALAEQEEHERKARETQPAQQAPTAKEEGPPHEVPQAEHAAAA